MTTGSKTIEFVKLVGNVLQKKADPRDNWSWFNLGPSYDPKKLPVPVNNPNANANANANPTTGAAPQGGTRIRINQQELANLMNQVAQLGALDQQAAQYFAHLIKTNPQQAGNLLQQMLNKGMTPQQLQQALIQAGAGSFIPEAVHLGPTSSGSGPPAAGGAGGQAPAGGDGGGNKGDSKGGGNDGKHKRKGRVRTRGFGWGGMLTAVGLSALASHLFNRYMGTPSGDEFAETKKLVEALKTQLKNQQRMLETSPYHYANVQALANELAARQNMTEMFANMLMQMAANRQHAAPQPIFI